MLKHILFFVRQRFGKTLITKRYRQFDGAFTDIRKKIMDKDWDESILNEIHYQARPYIMKLACEHYRIDIASSLFNDTYIKKTRDEMITEIIRQDNLEVFKRLDIPANDIFIVKCVMSGSKNIFTHLMKSNENLDMHLLLSLAIANNKYSIVEVIVSQMISPSSDDIAQMINDDRVDMLKMVLGHMDVSIDSNTYVRVKSIEMYQLLIKNGFEFG